MSRRLGLVSAAVAVAALAVPGSAMANGHRHDRSFKLVAKQTEFQMLDLAPSGSVGDQFVFADDLYRDGRWVGDDGGSCTITRFESYDEFDANCIDTLRLRGGQIALQGLVTFSDGGLDRSTVAITGGTGSYRGASGEVDIRAVSDTKDIYTVHLDRR
jgi:allene oxide cyclase-like protein